MWNVIQVKCIYCKEHNFQKQYIVARFLGFFESVHVRLMYIKIGTEDIIFADVKSDIISGVSLGESLQHTCFSCSFRLAAYITIFKYHAAC